jgi:hypothetical protein
MWPDLRSMRRDHFPSDPTNSIEIQYRQMVRTLPKKIAGGIIYIGSFA